MSDSRAAVGTRVKVLVVDDHELVRRALRTVLQEVAPEAQVLEADRCERAFALVREHPDLDLVLLDLGLPGIDGLTGLERLRREYPSLGVVVISAVAERASIIAALECGALGYVPKSSSSAVLADALRLVLDGGVYLPPEVLEAATQAPRSGEIVRLSEALGISTREAEVLERLTRGKSNKLIARELGLAEKTVKNHLSSVFRALDVATRTEALAKLHELRLHPAATPRR